MKEDETNNGEYDVNNFNIPKNIEKQNSTKSDDVQKFDTPIDKDLQKIQKIIRIIMISAVSIAVIIFAWNIFKELTKAIKSDEFESIRNDENYKITEVIDN
ncbi:MAG: hypothetical protein IKL55_03460 [Clostridia bacterium]|nr:hypothetical protein [Clostridia bacterium]